MNISTKYALRVALILGSVATGGLLVERSVSAAGVEVTPGQARGQAIFAGKGNCLSCHRVADQGSYMGPDLSAIGASRKAAEIQKAILDPSAEVQPQNKLFKVTNNDGTSITGRLLNQNVSIVQMLTSDDRLLTLKKSGLKSFDFIPTPPMPSYKDKLTEAEQTDLLSYLSSLQGVVKQ